MVRREDVQAISDDRRGACVLEAPTRSAHAPSNRPPGPDALALRTGDTVSWQTASPRPVTLPAYGEFPMVPAFRRSLQGGVLGVLFVACPVLITSSSAPSRPARTCAALQAWAQPYANTSLSLEQLARFDRAHRLAIFNVATPEARAAWWRAQIRQLGERPDLTSAQHALTVEAIGLLTPALYRHDTDATAAFNAFWTRADPAFASLEFRRVWSDLGVTASLSSAIGRTGADEFYCECKQGGGTAQCGGVSCGNPAGCTGVSGCGISGLETCNGMCQW